MILQNKVQKCGAWHQVKTEHKRKGGTYNKPTPTIVTLIHP